MLRLGHCNTLSENEINLFTSSNFVYFSENALLNATQSVFRVLLNRGFLESFDLDYYARALLTNASSSVH